MRIYLIVLALLMTSCASAPSRSARPVSAATASHGLAPAQHAAAPAGRTAGVAAPDEGACGGLASLSLELGTDALGGRLRLPAVAVGQNPETRSHNIMSAPPPVEASEILWLSVGDQDDSSAVRMAILVEELFRSAGEHLVHDLAEYAPEGWDRTARGQHVVARPSTLQDEGGDVVLLQDYVVDPDGLVLRATFVTSPEVARMGGCAALARRIAATLEPGPRHLELSTGPRTLEGRLTIDLPEASALVVEQGPDFTVYRVHPVVPLSAPGASLGVYVGGFPSFEQPSNAQTRTTRTLSQDVTWYDTASDGSAQTEALIQIDGAYLHVFYGAQDPAMLAKLRAAAESLHLVPPEAATP